MIQVRDNRGNYHDALAIYDNAGREIKEVRNNQGRLLFKNWNEIQGSPPITFRGYGKNLTECRIYGNTVQNGMPTPENPVEVQGCGERTVNLFDTNSQLIYSASLSKQYPDDTVDVFPYGTGGNKKSIFIKVNSNTTYTLSCRTSGDKLVIAEYNTEYTKSQLDSYTVNNRLASDREIFFNLKSGFTSYTFTTSATAKMICIYYCFNVLPTEIMLNEGSAPLPYEPYGYKIPISSGGKNLLDESASSDADATHINYNKNAPIILTAGQTYTLSCNTVCNGLYIRSAADDSNLASANNSNTLTYTPQVNVRAYCRVWNSNGITNLNPMLNCGSTQLPYEPYNRTTTPVYLGEVPTTRKIKELVLTGEEGWTITSNGILRIGLSGQLRPSTPLCTHYLGSNSTAWSNVPDKSVTVSISGYLAILDTTYTAAADFKSYLAAQYTAGTPVTVWYVLDEPETGIVNEPIQKIGDYSDELSIADIPTINGINSINATSADTTVQVQPSEIYIKGKIKSIT